MIPVPGRANVLWGIAAVVFALLWTAGVYALGWHTAGVQADLRQVKVELQTERDMQIEKDRLKGEKAALEKDMAEMAANHRTEMADAQQTIDRLHSDLRTGRARLSVAVKANTCTSADRGPTTAATGDQETRAELAPEAAAALAAIASDGDKAIRDLNTVIDLYQRSQQMKCY